MKLMIDKMNPFYRAARGMMMEKKVFDLADMCHLYFFQKHSSVLLIFACKNTLM